MIMQMRPTLCLGWAGLFAALMTAPASADGVKLGLVKAATAAVPFLAQQKGYFAAEGIPLEIVEFQAGEPMAVAAAAGAVDFGVAAPTAGFYNLAGQGAVEIIGGGNHESSGFHGYAYLVSNRAANAGLKTPKDFPGRSFAVTQIGSPGHYSLALVAEKYQFDLSTLRILPLQSIPNASSAVIGGNADAAVLSVAASMLPLMRAGQIRPLAWVGDETPWQSQVIFAATATIKNKPEVIERFLRAYRRAASEYHDAFTTPDGKRSDLPTAPAMLQSIANLFGESAGEAANGISYIDPDLRLDMADIRRQIAWYQSERMLKRAINAEDIIDRRDVVALMQ